MLSCHKIWLLLTFTILLSSHHSAAKSLSVTPQNDGISKSTSYNLELITDDVIHDKVENDIKKVIRVNPLDLHPLKDDTDALNMDSSLYKIQPLKPYNGKRKYLNLQRSKTNNGVTVESTLPNAPIFRTFSLLPSADKTSKAKHQPKKKNLHFLYNQEDLAGNLLSKSMRVHVAPGAYPVYYVVAKTNGRFGKYPVKSFDSPRAFMKYLQRLKLENLPAIKTDDDEA